MISAAQLAIGRGKTTLLQEISFQVPAGECWGIVGRNGSGKSTLLATLAGLIPARAGEIVVQGKCLADWRRADLALHLGFLPQRQPAVFPYTVEEFVSLGRVPWERSSEVADSPAAVEGALAALQLEGIRARPVTGLSGGEAQRVCIAQLLAQSTGILLLDEPLAHLDLLYQLEVMQVLRGLANGGHAVAIALHDLVLAWRFCDRILVLGPGAARLVDPHDSPGLAAALGWAFDVPFAIGAQGPHLRAGASE